MSHQIHTYSELRQQIHDKRHLTKLSLIFIAPSNSD